MKRQTQVTAGKAKPKGRYGVRAAIAFWGLCAMIGILVSDDPTVKAQDTVLYPSPTLDVDVPMGNPSSVSWIGPTWTLMSWQEAGRPRNLATDKRPTATFTQERVSGSGGCNQFSASYQTKSSDRITIGSIMATRMACTPDLMRQEAEFLAALEGAQDLKSDRSGQLKLQYRTAQGTIGTLIFGAKSADLISGSKPCK